MLLTNGPSRLIGGGRVPWYRAGGAPLPAAAYQPKGAANLAASYINLTGNAAYNAAPGVAPTWDATNGWQHSGTQYMATGITPGSGWAMLVRVAGMAVKANVTPAGCHDGGANYFGWTLYINDTNNNMDVFYESGTRASKVTSPALYAGVWGISGAAGYVNGTSAGVTLTGTPSNLPALIIGGRGLAASRTQLFRGSIQAVAIYSATLTAAQVAAVSAAMAAL